MSEATTMPPTTPAADNFEEIARIVLSWPYERREQLADKLEASLHPPGDEGLTREEWEKAWGDEIDQRIDDLKTGRVKGIPAEQVRAEIKARLARRRNGNDSASGR